MVIYAFLFYKPKIDILIIFLVKPDGVMDLVKIVLNTVNILVHLFRFIIS